jgi:hypothetical protein
VSEEAYVGGIIYIFLLMVWVGPESTDYRKEYQGPFPSYQVCETERKKHHFLEGRHIALQCSMESRTEWDVKFR